MSTATTEAASAIAADQPAADIGLGADKLMQMLEQMLVIRRFEERTAQSYQQAKIGGFCHIYIGQEAVAVGSIGAMRHEDPIITAYRDHGHAIARGMDPKYGMAEMFGKITGCAKGKGGSMHFFDKPNHMYGGHAIVGGQCPLGVGIAFAIQYQKKDEVCLCYLGDGALNQGGFHEAMNLAAVYNLPIIFVLENNAYSMGTHINRGTSMGEDLQYKAQSYGMRYAECDGLDAIDVYRCFTEQAEKTRGARPINYNEQSGRREDLPQYFADGRSPGPAFVNVRTYRYQGHSMSDPQKYRTKDEVAEYKDQDCIQRLVAYLIEHDLATQSQIDDLDNQAKQTAKDAVAYAEKSPDTPVEEMYTDVYAQPFGPFKKGDLPVMLREAE